MTTTKEVLQSTVNTETGTLKENSPNQKLSVGEFIDTLRGSGSKLIVLLSLGDGIVPIPAKKTKVIQSIVDDARFERSDLVRAFKKEINGNDAVFIDARFMEPTADNEKAEKVLQELEGFAPQLPSELKGQFYSVLSGLYEN